MLTLPPSVRIYVASAPADMRKCYDGHSAPVKQELGQDVFSGHLFVFVSRKGNRIKILTWDHDRLPSGASAEGVAAPAGRTNNGHDDPIMI